MHKTMWNSARWQQWASWMRHSSCSKRPKNRFELPEILLLLSLRWLSQRSFSNLLAASPERLLMLLFWLHWTSPWISGISFRTPNKESFAQMDMDAGKVRKSGACPVGKGVSDSVRSMDSEVTFVLISKRKRLFPDCSNELWSPPTGRNWQLKFENSDHGVFLNCCPKLEAGRSCEGKKGIL